MRPGLSGASPLAPDQTPTSPGRRSRVFASPQGPRGVVRRDYQPDPWVRSDAGSVGRRAGRLTGRGPGPKWPRSDPATKIERSRPLGRLEEHEDSSATLGGTSRDGGVVRFAHWWLCRIDAAERGSVDVDRNAIVPELVPELVPQLAFRLASHRCGGAHLCAGDADPRHAHPC